MTNNASARAEAVVLAWEMEDPIMRLHQHARRALVRLIQRELVETNAKHWAALAVLDPEGRFIDLVDAARNRMQVVVLADALAEKAQREHEQLEAEVERLEASLHTRGGLSETDRDAVDRGPAGPTEPPAGPFAAGPTVQEVS